MSRLRAVLVGAILITTLLCTPSARAGQWDQVSCVNPDGSSSGSSGWTLGQAGATSCDSQTPIIYQSLGGAYFVNGIYTPPAGSTISGGSLHIHGAVQTQSTGPEGTNRAEATMSAELASNQNQSLFSCQYTNSACQSFSEAITIPAGQYQAIQLSVGCTVPTEKACQDATTPYAEIDVDSAVLDLSNSAVPAAANFNGSALSGPDSGTASLQFTASESDGPGIYTVTAAVDGTPVYSATPSSGTCVPVGTDASSGALEFDSAEPCPQSESIAIPIDTTQLSNGSHELTVTLTDAAGNVAKVYDNTLTVDNASGTSTAAPPAGTSTAGSTTTTSSPTGTPDTTTTSSSVDGSTTSTTTTSANGTATTKSTATPAKSKSRQRSVRVKVNFTWVWRKAVTRLSRIVFAALPARTTVTIACSGSRHCPRNLGSTSTKLSLRALEKRIYSDTLTPGETVTFTLARKGYTAERIRATIRSGTYPKLELF